VLIFGAGAVVAVQTGTSPMGHYSLLGALLIATAIGAPLATGAALRIAVE
jgi:heme exporter protein B